MLETGLLARSGPTNLNIMSRVWQSSSAIITRLSNKIRGLGEAKCEEYDDSERLAQKRLDSIKIRIRLLSNEQDLASIRQLAESSEDPELASYAVSYLLEHDLNACVPFLVSLAKSYSHACLPALISLFNSGETELAQSILSERLNQGDYIYMIQHKKARALLFLDVLGAVDEFCKTNLCYQYFPVVWRSLADCPLEQEKLLAEILGDLNPGGLRYSPDSNMIPQEVKIQAMQLLYATCPPSYERSLWYASRDENNDVAFTASMACIEHWQTEGIVPESLEPFPMLNLNLLFYLSKLASTFQWRGPAGVMDLYNKWMQDVEELTNMDQKSDPHNYAVLRKQAEKTRDKLLEITEQRLNALQPIVDAVTNSLGLPHAKIRSTDVAGVAAAYLVGTGTVEFSKTTLLDDKPLTEEFMSSMLHELLHMEQDVLLIRMIADSIDLKFGQHGSKLKVLFHHYAEAIGYAPDSIFLLEVLRLRRDIPLSPQERQRAERLLHAAYDNLAACQEGKKISERMERIEESVAGIESGSYDYQLLSCLKDPRSLKGLFDNGHIPSVLIEEMANCRLKIEELVSAMSTVANGSPRSIFGRQDPISIALEYFANCQDDEDTPLAPILERFRIVISHMLVEEHRRLDKQLSEIRRAGYHEAEAYSISDRVEVIVKALRQGWYQFVD